MLLECAVAALTVATTLNYVPDYDTIYSYSALHVVPWPLTALLARSGPIVVGLKSRIWLQITVCLAYVLLLRPWAGIKAAIRLCSDFNRCVYEASSQ